MAIRISLDHIRGLMALRTKAEFRRNVSERCGVSTDRTSFGISESVARRVSQVKLEYCAADCRNNIEHGGLK